MKYWLLTTEYPPQFGGGIATYCLHTARMLAEAGHEVTVITPDDSLREPRRTENSEPRLRVVRFLPGQGPSYQVLGWVAALSHQFSEVVEALIGENGPPDLIESQDYLGIAYFLLHKQHILWPGLSRIPVVLTLHTPKFVCDLYDQAPLYKLPGYWTGEMERYCVQAADAVLSPSRYLWAEMQRHLDLTGVAGTVIPNPYRTAAEPGRAADAGGSQVLERGQLVYFGRTEYRKGIVQLLAHLAPLWAAGSEVRLQVVGGDTWFHPRGMMMAEHLQKRYHRYFENGQIRLEGRIPPEQLARRLEQAHLVLVPSLFENYPYTVVESMSWGKVVLASENGGQRELIEDGVSGFIFQHRADQFAAKLEQVLALSDRELAAIGEQARQRVAAVCSYPSVLERKQEVLEQVRRRQSGRRSYPVIRPRPRPASTTADRGDPGLLSIVIPYYNLGRWLEETVLSLQAVDYRPREIIVVNDGSDEVESLAKLEHVAAGYSLRVVHQANAGLAAARNTGAQAARGEFLAFLDADDLVAPEYYRWAIQLLEHYPDLSFVGCWTQYFGAAEGIWPCWDPEPPYFLISNTLTSGALLFRRADFLAWGGNDPVMEYGMEDYEAVVGMLEQGCRGAVIPKPLFQYRIRPDSMARGFNVDNRLYLTRLLSEKHPQIYQEHAVELFNLLNSNGPGYLYDNPTRDLPPVGFVSGTGAAVPLAASSLEVPPEVKHVLLRMWHNRAFRWLLGGFFRLRLDKLFYSRESR